MSAILVGVMGHVDHGKTALVGALTGIDTDRLKEEKARGVSIVPGYALLRTPEDEVDLIDLPGHERFVRAMIAGATGIAAVLIVVAANEGVKPQTLEHLAIARVLGVRRGVIAITKADLVAPEVAKAAAEAVAALARREGFAEPAIVLTSARDGTGLPELAQALGRLARAAPPQPDDGLPYLPVDRVFAVAGVGPVVTGTLRRGRLRVGDAVGLAPGGRTARVRSLQVHGRAVGEAGPGRRTAVGLRGVALQDLRPGLAVGAPDALAESAWLDVAVELLGSAPRALRTGESVRLLAGTLEVEARLRLLDRDALEPGARALAQIRCAEPVALPAREPFVLRRASPGLTLGGGRVLDPAARRRRRGPEAAAALRVLDEGSATAILRARLAEAGAGGAAVTDLARLVGIEPGRVRRRLAELGARPEGAERVVSAQAWADLAAGLQAALAAHHAAAPLDPGPTKERLLAALPPGTDPAVAGARLADLVAAGAIAAERGAHRQPGFQPSPEAGAAMRLLEETLLRGGLAPPDETDLLNTGPAAAQALRALLHGDVFVRAADRVQGRSILFHRDAVAKAKRALAARWGDGAPFLAREAGALLGISRKFSIPLLEHLDAVHFTRRRGDMRVIAQDGEAVREGAGSTPPRHSGARVSENPEPTTGR